MAIFTAASANLRPFVTVVLLVSLLAMTPEMASAAIKCGTITSTLRDCTPYLTVRAASPTEACCNGISKLNSLAKSTADRKAVCNCLKQLVTGSINSGRASALPGRCGVKVPYPISRSTDCNRVM